MRIDTNEVKNSGLEPMNDMNLLLGRQEEKKRTATPSIKKCVNKSITAELLAGARALSIADRHHFNLNLSDLLDKSTQCKRNWLLNAIAARQRFERQQANFEGIQTLSIANSKLIKWMTTGQAS